MDPGSVPSPFVTGMQLNAHMNKQVVVAGKVATVNEGAITLDCGEGGKVTVVRNRAAMIMIEPGMNIMVRGRVNPDLTVAESPSFPPTDLGEKFGKSRYE